MKVVYIEKKIILFFALPNKFLALILLTPPKKNPKAAIEPNTNTNTKP